MKNILGCLALILSFTSVLGQSELYYVVASESNTLYQVGPASPFLGVGSLQEEEGVLIGGFNGLTSNPITGENYVVYWEQDVGPSVRWLGKVDFGSMSVQTMGPLFDKIATLACSPEGHLYGLTGDGGQNPNTLYYIYMDGSVTEVADFSDSIDDDGEAIAFHPDNGTLYRMAGGSYFYQIDWENMTQELVTDNLYDGGTCGHAMHCHGDGFVTMATYFCSMTLDGVQDDCSPEFQPCVKGMLPVETSNVQRVPSPEAEVVSVIDLAGREVALRCNVPQLVIYSDGTVRKEFCFE